MRDYHQILTREIQGATVRLVCYCGFVTSWCSDTAEETATLVAAKEYHLHFADKAPADHNGRP